MAVQLSIPYETLVELIDQLPAKQRQALLTRLLGTTQTRQLSKEEKHALFHASILNVPVNEAPSIRREDWYDDDAR